MVRPRLVRAPVVTAAFALALPLGLGACPPPSEGEGEGEGEGEVCAAVDVDCRDTVFNDLEMSLTTAAPGLIESTASGDVFDVNVDATAGGFGGGDGWVYGKFTADGLEKVELLDDAAFDSTDWDIAFRRFVIRLNSGFSGPSCVSAARTAPDTDFDALGSVPDGLTFNKETGFMSDAASCTLVSDGSGLPGAPSVVLQNWWEYPAGCVATTGNVFVVQLADGSHLKLLVTQYYEGEGAQETCNETGEPDGESARIKLRYGFLP
jgi:hypothetical protein